MIKDSSKYYSQGKKKRKMYKREWPVRYQYCCHKSGGLQIPLCESQTEHESVMFWLCANRHPHPDKKAGVYSEIGSNPSAPLSANKASVGVLLPLLDMYYKKYKHQLQRIKWHTEGRIQSLGNITCEKKINWRLLWVLRIEKGGLWDMIGLQSLKETMKIKAKNFYTPQGQLYFCSRMWGLYKAFNKNFPKLRTVGDTV